MMAVRMGGLQDANKYYYQNFLRRPLNHYCTPHPPPPRPVCVPHQYAQANHPFTGPFGLQPATVPSNSMPPLLQTESKDYFLDLDCPDLLDSDIGTSPTASSYTSASSYIAPSPSQDAKDLLLADHGATIYSPTADLSPQPNFSDGCFNPFTFPCWPLPQAAAPFKSFQQPFQDVWPDSLASNSQSIFEGYHAHSAADIPAHNESSGLAAFQGTFHTANSYVPVVKMPEQNMPTPFSVNCTQDGLVAPGHLFNSTLDGYSFADSSSTFLSTQLSADAGFQSEPSNIDDDTDMDLSLEEAQETQEARAMVKSLPDPSRTTKDEYLREGRRRGLSYKEIKRRGGFTEAESTLRGRIRILSKPKEMRVRKPQWHRGDIMLLREAVEHFSDAMHTSTSGRKTNVRQRENFSKLPWKKIAEWMLAQGSSYPFAGATCARKWEQIRGISF